MSPFKKVLVSKVFIERLVKQLTRVSTLGSSHTTDARAGKAYISKVLHQRK
jgi:hypothetical protein